MENDNVKCPKCGTTFNKMFLMGKQGNCDICPMCGAELQDAEEHPDWITWWYYKDIEYGDLSLWDKPPLRLERYELIQEFKAPPRDSTGSSEKAKEILRTYIPDAFAGPKKADAVFCPRCGCNEFTLLNRGYSILTGFLGSGNVKRVCNRCKKEF